MQKTLLFGFAMMGFASFALFASAGEDKKTIVEKKLPAVRDIDLKGISFERKGGAAEKPLVFAKEEDLQALAGAKNLQDRIRKATDFSKEYALLFAWSGSGMDRLVRGDVVENKVSFTYTRGLTRDLRQHLHGFVLPRGTTYAVETGKPKFGK